MSQTDHSATVHHACLLACMSQVLPSRWPSCMFIMLACYQAVGSDACPSHLPVCRPACPRLKKKIEDDCAACPPRPPVGLHVPVISWWTEFHAVITGLHPLCRLFWYSNWHAYQAHSNLIVWTKSWRLHVMMMPLACARISSKESIW